MVPCHLFLCILITGSFLFLNYYHGEHCLKIFEMTREPIPDNSVGKYRAEGGGVECRTVIDAAHIDEPARNPCQLSISWTSQYIDSYGNWFG